MLLNALPMIGAGILFVVLDSLWPVGSKSLFLNVLPLMVLAYCGVEAIFRRQHYVDRPEGRREYFFALAVILGASASVLAISLREKFDVFHMGLLALLLSLLARVVAGQLLLLTFKILPRG